MGITGSGKLWVFLSPNHPVKEETPKQCNHFEVSLCRLEAKEMHSGPTVRRLKGEEVEEEQLQEAPFVERLSMSI